MGTLTHSFFGKQMAVDWFSNLTDEERNSILKKYNINKTIEEGTLLNKDVFDMYWKEHKE